MFCRTGLVVKAPDSLQRFEDHGLIGMCHLIGSPLTLQVSENLQLENEDTDTKTRAYTHTHTHTHNRVSQLFCYILVTWGTIRTLRVFLQRLWRWRTTLDRDMQSLPDTHSVLLTRFASMSWSTASESIILGLLDLSWSLKFLQLEQNFLNSGYLTVINCTSTFTFIFPMKNILACFRDVIYQFKLVKHKFSN